MVSNNKFTITNIEEIISEMTSHGVGVKKVLLNNDDTVSAITQIAYTSFKGAEKITEHIHPTMEEYFFVIDGNILFKLDNKSHIVTPGNFIRVNSGVAHSLEILTNSTILTIGVAL